ncbi:MAG: FAD-dependent oxidoreductase [Actinomycetota bacterium]|nr:FAD-dependent oxidoreductase [Actinomycetota bacterium]
MGAEAITAHRPRPRPRVAIVGAGFGGLDAAQHLAGAGAEIVLIDRDNYHGFWSPLYQVATAALAPEDIAHPIRAIFSGHRDLAVRHGEVTGLDLEARRLVLDRGEPID